MAAPTSSTISWDALASTTLYKMRPDMADAIFLGNPILGLIYNKRETLDGGQFITVPVMYQQNSTFKYYSGYDPLDITAQEGMTSAVFNWRNAAITISISGEEERKNSGEAAKLNLLKKKIEQGTNTMRERLNQDLLQLSTAKLAGAILGLDEAVEDVAAASQGTYGGIPRSTQTWWRNQVVDSSAEANDTWSEFLTNLYIACTEGTQHPNLGVCDKNAYAGLEKALLNTNTTGPFRVMADQKMLDLGWDNIKYKGAAIVPDSYCQANVFYFLNTNFLHLYVSSQADLTVRPFQRPINQDSMVASVIWMGQFLCSNPRFQGAGFGGTLSTMAWAD